MSDLRKVLTLIACGCMCLAIVTTASAEYTGVKAVNKDDPDTDFLCTQANGQNVPFPLTVCNVYAMFDNGADRLLSVGNGDMQVFNGGNPGTFYQNPFNAVDTSPACAFIPLFPDLICDSFVTIGRKCSDPTDGSTTDPDWLTAEFNLNGHIVGGWFNASPPNGQGDAGNYPDLQVLFLQSSVQQGLSMSGDIDVFWLDPISGETIAEVDVPVECAAKCTEGEPCDDGDPCTENDLCTSGVCTGTPIVCDDDNICTDDSCVDGQCVFTPNNEACDDGDACTENDQCSGGMCQGGGPVDCDDGDACTNDDCDPATGCVYTDVDCDDENACTTDTCDPMMGCMHEDIICDDDNCCTNDSCHPDTGCVYEQVPCPEGEACNPDTCVCEEIPCTTDPECDDGNPCTDDVCEPGVGCVYTNNMDPCDDGNACTENDMCSEGECGGSPVDCDDDNVCTDDSCNPETGCVYENNNEMCDDGNACTQTDQCSEGECVGGDEVECEEGFVCDPATGECVEVSDFLDITPGKCPNTLRRNGLGFVKVSLLGTDELDVNNVDISTLLLRNADDPMCEGAVAPRMTPRPHVRDRATPFLGELCNCHSRRKDGIDDLDMKFKLAEIVNELCLADLPAGTEVRLELSGLTIGGMPVRAADCVILGRDLGPNP